MKNLFEKYGWLRVILALLATLMLMGIFAFFRQRAMPAPQADPLLPGPVTVRVHHHKTDEIIEMDMEAYLLGVVAAEMPASFEMEALKAQAVAARTYTWQKVTQGGCREGADICTDSTHCQAYRDAQARRSGWGRAADEYESKIRRAVAQTHGEILTYQGEPILALFHSTSGGKTENVENVYAQALPYLQSVDSPGEEKAPRYERTVSMSAAAFIRQLKAENNSFACTAKRLPQAISEPERTPSGRVAQIKIANKTFTGRQMRKALGLDSTNFSISVNNNKVYITTRGYGHGVGMSQYGADAMAKAGCEYDAILCHYYTGVEITALYTR
ncbi:MAG: stage II sporulation protein D [Clostridia bacterium]|nr:stage II sporulation protein D [Clostridia bacterium]